MSQAKRRSAASRLAQPGDRRAPNGRCAASDRVAVPIHLCSSTGELPDDVTCSYLMHAPNSESKQGRRVRRYLAHKKTIRAASEIEYAQRRVIEQFVHHAEAKRDFRAAPELLQPLIEGKAQR